MQLLEPTERRWDRRRFPTPECTHTRCPNGSRLADAPDCRCRRRCGCPTRANRSGPVRVRGQQAAPAEPRRRNAAPHIRSQARRRRQITVRADSSLPQPPKMLTARPAITAIVTSDVWPSAIIKTLTGVVNGYVSVGLNAVAVLNERKM